MSPSTFAEALHQRMALTEISDVQRSLEQMEASTGSLPPRATALQSPETPNPYASPRPAFRSADSCEPRKSW